MVGREATSGPRGPVSWGVASRPPLALLTLVRPARSGCATLAYLGEQAGGQLRLLRQRRLVEEVLAEPGVAADTKRRLRLAVEAREFGVRELGLRGGDAYTRYLDTRGRPVAWNLSAAPKDQLGACLHRFPLVGATPYLGFFKESDARRAQARFEARGLDTYLRPVGGYSTLGFTSDPIYDSMLEGSDAAIVEGVLHEMLHGTVFVPGRFDFNESLATLVGFHGAATFFRRRGDAREAQALLDEAVRRQAREERFGEWLEGTIASLEALYRAELPREEKLRRREALFVAAQEDYRRRLPPAPGRPLPSLLRRPLNNAILAAGAVYHRELPLQRHLLGRLGGDLAALVRLTRHAAEEHDDAVAYLRDLAGLPPEPPRRRRAIPRC